MASSRPRYTYDALLSFKGEDTHNNFVSHLYTALAHKGIHTFKDDENLESGKSILPELWSAIRESRFSIIVLSKNYASSRWCLDELVEALECSNTTVYPIFYHVDPLEVRRQRGSFGEVFDELVSKQGVLGMKNVQRSESMFIQEVVGLLFRKLSHTYSSIGEDLVGMDSRMEKVIKLLGLGVDDARYSFIENVREVSKKCGLKTLQEQLISEILMENDLKVGSDGRVVHMIRNMECRKKVLIVLDDVDESTKLKNLGTKKVEGIVVQYPDPSGLDSKDFPFLKQLKLRPKAFVKMSNLRILKICCMHLSEDLKYLSNKLRYLDWLGYPMKYMPLTFQPKHLVKLHLTYSDIEQLWEGTMHLDKLRIMNLSHLTYLTKSPDFKGVPNLERLILEGCTGLVNLHPSIVVVKRLICLNLKDCKNLKSLPCGIQLEYLEVFIVFGCSKLVNILVSMGYTRCLSKLRLAGAGISELPPSWKQYGKFTCKHESTLKVVGLVFEWLQEASRIARDFI
ncbi:disease resistance-like protein DSC1 [Camellia sinensis]|uniref:disease resistance-like protein DSC1 n=1 Tax=Camellia sinensis TaxID=4442 RepID=UPI0010359934|nr:disease resistance-like protein DSC1 [Camellia sinensis]